MISGPGAVAISGPFRRCGFAEVEGSDPIALPVRPSDQIGELDMDEGGLVAIRADVAGEEVDPLLPAVDGDGDGVAYLLDQGRRRGPEEESAQVAAIIGKHYSLAGNGREEDGQALLDIGDSAHH